MVDVLKYLKRNKVISVKDATLMLGNRLSIYRLEDQGKVIKVQPSGLGYFTLPNIEEGEAQFAIVAKYYPQCVVSGRTALTLYGLGQDYIKEIDVDIPNTTNLKNPLLNVHRVLPKKINHTVVRSFKDRGVPMQIKIYSVERVLHEAYKYFGLTDAFYRTLKRYRANYLDQNKPGNQYDTIRKINKKIGSIIVNFLAMEDVDE